MANWGRLLPSATPSHIAQSRAFASCPRAATLDRIELLAGGWMRIELLTIVNFRGISRLEWNAHRQSICCLIGVGDSAKTTVLMQPKLRCHRVG